MSHPTPDQKGQKRTPSRHPIASKPTHLVKPVSKAPTREEREALTEKRRAEYIKSLKPETKVIQVKEPVQILKKEPVTQKQVKPPMQTLISNANITKKSSSLK